MQRILSDEGIRLLPSAETHDVRGHSGERVSLSLWPHVIGSIRGRYFVLTQQELNAEEAKQFGVVNEIVNCERLLDRALEIATGIAKLPPLTVSYTRVALTQPLRRVVDESVGDGLALEGISAADLAYCGAAD